MTKGGGGKTKSKYTRKISRCKYTFELKQKIRETADDPKEIQDQEDSVMIFGAILLIIPIIYLHWYRHIFSWWRALLKLGVFVSWNCGMLLGYERTTHHLHKELIPYIFRSGLINTLFSSMLVCLLICFNCKP